MLAFWLSGRVAVVALCVAVVALTLVLWSRTRPPVLTSSTLPPVMRRGVFWWLALTCAFAAVAAAWVLLRGPLGLPRHGVFRFVPLALGLTPLLVINPLYLWRTSWIRRAAAEANGRLCTHCAYNVTGLPVVGRCPECGCAYDVEKDRPLWEDAGMRSGAKSRRDRAGLPREADAASPAE